MHDLLHAPETSGIGYSLRMRFQVSADLSSDGHRLAEQVVPPAAAIQLNAAQDVLDRLLFEARHTQQAVGSAESFQLFDSLNAELVVNLFRCLWAHTWNFHHLHEPQRDFMLQLLVEFHPSAL